MDEGKNLNENETAAPETQEIQDTQPAEETPVVTEPVKPKKDWRKEVREWVISIAVALFAVFVIRTFLFQIIRVDGSSMYDTLEDNERLFVTVLDVKLGGVNRNDVVICHYPNRGSTNFVKRCVAVPGDTVYRKDGINHVVYTDSNGETVDESLDDPFEAGSMYYVSDPDDNYDPYTLGENEYFVVGDNRFNSHDSRDWNDSDPDNDVGPITGDMIVGRVRYVFWPLSNARVVK